MPQAELRSDQGARRAARRPVRLPLRRAADRVAGRRVRRHPRRRHRRRARARTDRRHGRPDRRCTAGQRVIAVDLVPERLARVAAPASRSLDLGQHDDDELGEVDPGADRRAAVPTRSSTPSAWRPTARPSPKAAQKVTGLLPDAVSARSSCSTAGVDRLAALHRRHRRSYAAAARSRSSASTAAWPTRCRC